MSVTTPSLANANVGIAVPVEHSIIIPINVKRDRIIKTLFGATIHCKCTVNDEVRLTIWILALVGALAVLGFFVSDVSTRGLSPSQLQQTEEWVAVLIGGVFSALASLLSLVQIRDHKKNWVHPPSQRCVIRILLMVPVYAVSAFASMIFIQQSLYFDFVRGCYEAFVIYQFMLLLTKYLGGEEGVTESLVCKPGSLSWPAPLGCCFPPVTPSYKFLVGLKYGTLQYTILNPIVSVIAVALNMFDLYGDGVVNFEQGYVYIALLQNCSQLVALYCLVWFYITLKNELAPFKPMPKFLVVKSVVFFTFWQSVALAVLVHFEILPSTSNLSVGQVQIGLQDLLVCVEMFLAAAAHKYTFGYETYANGSMKLLMDQRAIYIAQLHYQRFVQKQKKKQKKKNNKNKNKKKQDNNSNGNSNQQNKYSNNDNSKKPNVTAVVVTYDDLESGGAFCADGTEHPIAAGLVYSVDEKEMHADTTVSNQTIKKIEDLTRS